MVEGVVGIVGDLAAGCDDGGLVPIFIIPEGRGFGKGILGRRFGGVGGAAISRTARQVAERLRRDRRLARRVRQCELAFLDRQLQMEV